MILRSQVAGCGAYLPERIITNRELADRLDTSDEWIRQRTGIGERRVAAPGELTSDLACRAAQRALASAGMSGSDLDLLVSRRRRRTTPFRRPRQRFKPGSE